MTKDQVAELIESIKEPLSPEDFLVALATKAEEAEREACAKLCESFEGQRRYVDDIADAIRVRGET